MWYVPADETRQPEKLQPASKTRLARVAHPAAHSQPSRAIVPASDPTHLGAAVAAPELPAPATTALVRTVEHAPLRIEIESTVKDGALAIFADQTVVYTTELRDGHGAQLERTLAAGPHQLRVALYRPDKSLQVMKEGLGEIRTDSPNALKIQVGMKSKLLVKRERSLVVTWPSATQPSGEGAAAPASLAASTK